jgi:uncharacterized membrane protein YhiD involved in acid resistance
MIAPQVVVLRIAIAFVFGVIVGVEREWRHKNAGMKTNTLVAIGSAAFAMMSDTFGANNHNPAMLAAAVVSGIGFIGAGVIIHRGATVQGVTTAATLWANASMGVAVGLGYYAAGAAVFLAVILVQFGLRLVEVRIDAHRQPRREIEIRVECREDSVEALNHAWREFAATRQIFAMRHSTLRRGTAVIWRTAFVAVAGRGLDLTTIEEGLVKVDGIVSIDARQTMPGDELS